MPNAALTHPKTVEAAPFLKWAGGKTQLLGRVLPQLPEKIKTYYEPFIGGGAVFFALANQKRFKRAVIGDQNPALVEAYQTVRDEPQALIELLEEHAHYAKDQEYFYSVRAVDIESLSVVERVARLMFLNKTCFNGLYRVNRKGQFNVPFGRYAKPRVLDEGRIMACSKALQGVKIVQGDFAALAKKAKERDAIYFDPPYVPISKTSSFMSYDKHPFGPTEHQRLVDAYKACWERGATAVLSNSDCPETRKLYSGLDVQIVSASRSINSAAGKRGKINELLVVGPRATRARNKISKSSARSALLKDSALSAAKKKVAASRKRAA